MLNPIFICGSILGRFSWSKLADGAAAREHVQKSYTFVYVFTFGIVPLPSLSDIYFKIFKYKENLHVFFSVLEFYPFSLFQTYL